MSEPIILVRHLTHVYTQAGGPQKVALTDVSLEIERGSCTAIIGVTGSGKSTLIQHFNGLLFPTEGEVIVDGVKVEEKGMDLRSLRQRVGLLFQFPEMQLFETTIFNDVAFGPRRMGLSPREVEGRVHAALESVGLAPEAYARRSPLELSGGQRRRVALAGVLAMRPSVLILDEPTVGLDAEARTEFYRYLRVFCREQGMTVILVSHDMTEVAALADTLLILSSGQLVAWDKPQKLFARVEQLLDWGLAPPPLHELFALLRQNGLPIPAETYTLEEALAWVQAQSKLFVHRCKL
ncbi:energy-coupling factor transporter ATPase [Ktedonospora formicarum]|uniref:Energy-coupling factor transporter ATP-binding protein EcfA2 n=1 Tax=Ktedonospora formicarum TaxID=2778364 RepID=A0A8J3I115_9CHLR|nr:energy-coupling factor transporter ATPase [Ktedonospora formicarum]GHO42939.1 energy-coupling factor transporter ATP-binding protein EcfA [Ktedonospora formicarum]